MADRPKRPPTPFRDTRPRIEPPPPPRARPRGGLDDKRAELVRTYADEMPSAPPSEPPPESLPPESDPPTTIGVPNVANVPHYARPRMVELGPDQTIRPRQSWPRKVKEWAETLGHAQKIVLAVIAIVGALGTVTTAVYKGGEAVYRWYATRPSAQDLEDKFSQCAALVKSKAEKTDVNALRDEVGDAGVLAGDNWDKQDEINRNVHKDLNRLRPRMPPASMGPKAKIEGRR